MKIYPVKFTTTIEVEETVVANNDAEAMEKAQTMADNREVGEHQLDVDWEIHVGKGKKL